MNNLTGVVLCGGQSKRMGSDKGLLSINNMPWAVFVSKKLESVNLPIAVSINQQQQKAYQSIFPETPLILDKVAIDGPLNGLLSIHQTLPKQDILLMACDMIDMDRHTLVTLIETYKNEPDFDFYAYEYEGFTQPFCAIYTAIGLAKINEEFGANQISRYSLHERFESENTKYIPLKNDKAFNNYNSL